MKEVTVNSWEDLQKNISKIIFSINKDENLKLAAASNPLLALEELGYKINEDVTDQIEERLRFKPDEAAKLSDLRNSIYKLAGKKFNLRSDEELNTVLFKDLRIEAYDDKGCLIKKDVKVRKKGDAEDELMTYKDLHPIIEVLLKFREIDSSVAGFANKDTYQKIRTGSYGEKSNIHLAIRFQKDKK